MKKHLFTLAGIQELRENIMSGILTNTQHLMKSEWYVDEEENRALHGHLEELIRYCYKWKYVWDYFEQLQLEQNMLSIKQRFWTNSRERQNMVRWTVGQVQNSPEVVEEYYDNIWNEFKNVIAYHRKSVLFQKHQYKFLELLDM